MYAALNYLPFVSACMTLWMHFLFFYQSMRIMLKIHLLHLKLDYVTLESRNGLAALLVGVLEGPSDGVSFFEVLKCCTTAFGMHFERYVMTFTGIFASPLKIMVYPFLRS